MPHDHAGWRSGPDSLAPRGWDRARTPSEAGGAASRSAISTVCAANSALRTAAHDTRSSRRTVSLVGPLGQPRDDVLQIAPVAGPVTGPGHLLGDDLAAATALEPADLRLEPHLRAARVHMPPAAHRPVVGRRGGPATHRAGQAPCPAAQADHDPLRREGDRPHGRVLDREHAVECSRDAHSASHP